MAKSSTWPVSRRDLERLLRSLGRAETARLFGVSVEQIFELERRYDRVEIPTPGGEEDV